MAASTSIEWTDKTWNPTRGCRRLSPGCLHCYAERVAYRFSGPGKPYEGLVKLGKGGPVWTGEGRFIPSALDEPLGWRKPQRIFVNSMSDLFYDGFSDAQIDQVYAVMLLTPWHTHQVLTKRPERAARYLADPMLYSRVLEAANQIRAARRGRKHGPGKASLDQIAISNPATHPPRWIWLLTSVENQATADERIPHLLRCPAAVRGVSYEPALGAVDFSRWLRCSGCGATGARRGAGQCCPDRTEVLDWLIAGGESGPGARECDLAWLRSAVAQARAAEMPCFVKQLGARRSCTFPARSPLEDIQAWQRDRARIKHPKGGDITQWPAELRVRAFPQVGEVLCSALKAHPAEREVPNRPGFGVTAPDTDHAPSTATAPDAAPVAARVTDTVTAPDTDTTRIRYGSGTDNDTDTARIICVTPQRERS